MNVFVYYNLHKKTFSIKSLEGDRKGKVIGYSNQLILLNAKFNVSENGRLRVLKEKRKNVHAGIIGEWNPEQQIELNTRGREITYDPYKYSTFVFVDTKEPVYEMNKVLLDNKKVYEFNLV